MVEIAPTNSVRRRYVSWPNMAAEMVHMTACEKTEFRFHADCHLLVLCERGVRNAGETLVEGLPSSTQRDVTGKLIFVPAGHEYRDRHQPRVPGRLTFFYIDPAAMPSMGGDARVSLTPRLFFEDATLFATAHKLAALIEGPDTDDRSYLGALGQVLAHELLRLSLGGAAAKPAIRGGLAGWQQRTVSAFIEEHLAEPISLATLAGLVNLSPYHFCRAFKQSFGVPPHRYHMIQRIEHAKTLLAKPAPSVTDIGLRVGFSETSSFSAAFRKATGHTPTAYHRSLA
jgi:AraC family transcriptional regulator